MSSYNPSPDPSPPSEPVQGEWIEARPSRNVHPVFTPYVVYGLIAINVLVFAITGLRGGLMDTDVEVLLHFGALFPPAVWQHEWWRLLTAMFLHGGLLHIAFNMWALRNLGSDLERIYGRAGFLALYLGAGWMGSLASLMFTLGAGVGASGAIFGLAGAWLAIALRHREYFQSFGSNVLAVVAINLFIGFSSGGRIDNNAHIGGLVGGFLLAQVLPNALPEFRAVNWRRPAAVAMLLAFLALTPLAMRLSEQRLKPRYQQLEAAQGGDQGQR